MLIGHDHFQGRAQRENIFISLSLWLGALRASVRDFYFEGQMHKMVSPTSNQSTLCRSAGCITRMYIRRAVRTRKKCLSAHTNNFGLVGKGNLIFISYYKDA
jgi:hypothetical protein